jgi:hypothetical protein
MLLDYLKIPQADLDAAELVKEVPEILGLPSAHEFLWEIGVVKSHVPERWMTEKRSAWAFKFGERGGSFTDSIPAASTFFIPWIADLDRGLNIASRSTRFPSALIFLPRCNWHFVNSNPSHQLRKPWSLL